MARFWRDFGVSVRSLFPGYVIAAPARSTVYVHFPRFSSCTFARAFFQFHSDKKRGRGPAREMRFSVPASVGGVGRRPGGRCPVRGLFDFPISLCSVFARFYFFRSCIEVKLKNSLASLLLHFIFSSAHVS